MVENSHYQFFKENLLLLKKAIFSHLGLTHPHIISACKQSPPKKVPVKYPGNSWKMCGKQSGFLGVQVNPLLKGVQFCPRLIAGITAGTWGVKNLPFQPFFPSKRKGTFSIKVGFLFIYEFPPLHPMNMLSKRFIFGYKPLFVSLWDMVGYQSGNNDNWIWSTI